MIDNHSIYHARDGHLNWDLFQQTDWILFKEKR